MKWMATLIVGLLVVQLASADDLWLTIPGSPKQPGSGKKVVLVSGDEEYRSEQTLSQLAQILAKQHGFDCTVLFAIDPKDGSVNPNQVNNIPGLEALENADLLILFTRFRNLPDAQMKFIADYVESGKPVIGLRTSTHAFANPKSEKYAKYHWQSKVPGWEGGFGRTILGETWVAHHGHHGKEGTRGILNPDKANHPILRGIANGDVYGTSDVYTAMPPADCNILINGEVTESFAFDAKATAGEKNKPMMPISWTRTVNNARIFTTTMGASEDFSYEGTRRMLVNATYWTTGLEQQIPAKSSVKIVGTFKPLPFKNNGFHKGHKPADYLK
ncbi:MAG: ThuA domain-containing protein [Gemmataceae bacterium]